MVSSWVASATAVPSESGSGVPLPYRLPVAACGGSRRASSPAMTAASAEAINQYGLESDAPERNSIRDASGRLFHQRAHRGAAVVAAPVDGVGREGVGRKAAIGVDRVRTEQGDRRQMLDQTGDGIQRQLTFGAVDCRERRLIVAPQ